jgi:CRISPR system Cascade subunit CasE
MPYLTQIVFDCALMTRLRIRDTYDWHQRAWECFPGRPRDKRDFLTRLEDEGDCVRLLILSPAPPVRPSWCPAEAWDGTKKIGEAYLSRRCYRFQLRANPTKKVKAFNPDGSERPNGRRVPLVKREELLEWLRRKGEVGGFIADEETVQTILLGPAWFQGRQGRAVLSCVDYRGMLRVTDRPRFERAFQRGIGSAKAFGLGMLVIVPLQ